MERWDNTDPGDRDKHRLLERLCQRVDIDPSEFLGICVTIAHKFQLDVTALVSAVDLEEVMEASLAQAKTAHGVQDRKLIFEHKGLVQKGPGVAIQVNQAGAGMLPDFRAIAEIALQAQQREALPPAPKEYVDAELV